MGDSSHQGDRSWRLGVSKTSDTACPKTTTSSDTSRWRMSGPGGIRHVSVWARQCPMEQRTNGGTPRADRSSRPGTRRIVGSSSLSLFFAIPDERSIDAPSHDECSKSEGYKRRSQGRHPFRCRADHSRPSLAVRPLPEVSSRTNGGHLLRAPGFSQPP